MASSDGSGATRLAPGEPVPGTGYVAVQPLDRGPGGDTPHPGRGGPADGGETWSVRHERGGEEYVMKLLPVGHPDRAELALRVRRVETRMQSGFRHRNLVAVLDVGVTSDGQPFFVLEKLTGRTVRAELDARGSIALPRALDVASQVLDGVNAAHGAGAIHRDLRPEQLFLCADGVVKVLGFGKILDVGSEGVVAMTARGRQGSPYAAPELVAGALVDGRADVFSMGVVLYEMVTGKLPFAAPRGETTPVSPPSAVAAQLVPAELDAMVLRAISVDPRDRQGNAGAFLQQVTQLQGRISAQSGKLRSQEPLSEAPTKWAGAPPKQHEPRVSGDTAVFSLTSGDGSTGGENVYTIAPGTLLAGKYKVLRIIGKGGMGLVVEARHIHLETRVAMKFLLPEFMSYSEASGRFLREARSASKLTSHHVARVLDVGTLDAGEPYMVMEYLAGEDLAYHAHAQTPLTIGDAIEYITQACDAIAEAHKLGIVHRDIKPANLFLTRRSDGSPLVKVLDFGISKVVGESSGDVALTQTTTILGSALYMSPEQMQSAKNVDQRTDIYALGVCLFELIGREQPYFAESFPELCAKVFTSPPKSLRSLRPDVPEALERAIEKALAREPDKRYQNVSELVQAISPFARLDTRSRMEGLLRQHQPLLRLQPPAPMAKTVSAKAMRPIAPSPPAAAPPRRSRWPLFLGLAVCAGGAALAWKTLASRAPSLAGIEAEPTLAAPAAIPPGAVTASEATAAPSATETGPAPAAVASASPSAAPGTSASGAPSAAAATTPSARPATAAVDRRPREQPTQAAAASPPPTAAGPAPGVNRELTQETCSVTMPDGTKKVVPCP